MVQNFNGMGLNWRVTTFTKIPPQGVAGPTETQPLGILEGTLKSMAEKGLDNKET